MFAPPLESTEPVYGCELAQRPNAASSAKEKLVRVRPVHGCGEGRMTVFFGGRGKAGGGQTEPGRGVGLA